MALTGLTEPDGQNNVADFHRFQAPVVARGRIARFDARLKTILVLAAIGVNLASANIIAPLLISQAALLSLAAAGVSHRRIISRLGLPIMMAVVVFATQSLLFGETVAGQVNIAGWTLSLYTEGIERGILIMSRIFAGASIMLWLALSTPPEKLISTAGWFRLPRVVVEIMVLMYRFIFVLLEEAAAIRQAQQLRLGYSRWRQGIGSAGILAAGLFFRAYDRAERLFTAMTVRGYTGQPLSASAAGFTTADYVFLAVALSLLLVIHLLGGAGI